MEKSKRYRNTKFDSKTFVDADQLLKSTASTKISYGTLRVQSEEDAEWKFDTPEEFFAAADRGPVVFVATSADNKFGLHVFNTSNTIVHVIIRAPDRDKIESIFSVFDVNAERCRVPEEDAPRETKVFIGHGQDPQWRDLKDHLHEQHGYSVEAYEIGSRAGHTIRDILEEMLRDSSFALLVMTGEDETKDGKTLARQNVVHEAGLFQGKLGFSRAIILLEEGTEEFSNILAYNRSGFQKEK